MNKARILLILKVAGFEFLLAIATALLAIVGGVRYLEFTNSDAANAAWSPAIYSFGPWPFVAAGIASVVVAVVAINKIRAL